MLICIIYEYIQVSDLDNFLANDKIRLGSILGVWFQVGDNFQQPPGVVHDLGLLPNTLTPHDLLEPVELGCDEDMGVEQVDPPGGIVVAHLTPGDHGQFAGVVVDGLHLGGVVLHRPHHGALHRVHRVHVESLLIQRYRVLVARTTRSVWRQGTLGNQNHLLVVDNIQRNKFSSLDWVLPLHAIHHKLVRRTISERFSGSGNRNIVIFWPSNPFKIVYISMVYKILIDTLKSFTGNLEVEKFLCRSRNDSYASNEMNT
mmetsp:Transcript_26905/g.45371  ORF Transcript_26905/g.45371 Transcript_26905/m.45371 type:complete len:258 (+) Transcript_26905:177-950(+)